MTATRALIDTLKRRASDMAQPFIEAAGQPNASEMERAFGEAARLILRDAEVRAQLLPRDEFERRVEAFKSWHRRHEAKMRREIGRLFERGFRTRRRARFPRRGGRPPPSSTTARRSSISGSKATR